MADLFEPDGRRSEPRVLRREGRPTLKFGTLGQKFMLTPRPLEHLQVIVGEFERGGSTGDEPYTHGDSEELLVVLDGIVHLQLGTEIFELRSGDSIDYRSSTRAPWQELRRPESSDAGRVTRRFLRLQDPARQK